jgi:hypothetical protein
MPSVTARATRRLIEDRKRRGLPETFAPRLSRREGRLVLDFATQPAAEDKVSNDHGLSLYMAPEVADDPDHAVVDLQKKDGADRLVLLRGRAQAE